MGSEQRAAVQSGIPELHRPHEVTVKDLGFRDRRGSRLGFANAPVRTRSVLDQQTGSRAFFIAADYPVAGLGLEQMLSEVRPTKGVVIGMERYATDGDWELPDPGANFDNSAQLLFDHSKIAGFNEFSDVQRPTWRKIIRDKDFDSFYYPYTALRFIDPERFISQFRRREIADIWGNMGHEGQFEEMLHSYLPRHEVFDDAYYNLFQIENSHPLVLMDPASGEVTTNYHWIGYRGNPREVTYQPWNADTGVHTFSHSGVTAETTLGDINAEGFYEELDVRMTFGEDYRRKAIFPLIAWKETPSGKRRFLLQDEAERLLPDDMRVPGQDVMLGRVGLAYLQPEVTGTFDIAMPFPHKPDEDPQPIMSAQVPVWVTMPHHAKQLLATPAVTELQNHIL